MKDRETVEDLGAFFGKYTAFEDGIQWAKEKVEKVENPYTQYAGGAMEHEMGFERCRQAILKALESK